MPSVTKPALSLSLPISQWLPRRPQRLALLGVLLAAGCLSSATGSMVAPVFPEVVEQLQFDPEWSGLLVSTHTLTTALATPLLGLLAGRIGKVRVLVLSLIGYAVFGFSGAFVSSYGAMMLSRGLVGASSGGIAAVSIGILSDLYDGDARTKMLGYVTSALASATVIFPVLGGWAGNYRWQYAFYLYGIALPVAFTAFLVLRRQPASATPAVDLSQADGMGQYLRQSRVQVLLIGLALTSALFYVVVVYAPLYLKEAINASPIVNGGVLAARAVGAAVVSAVGASRMAKRIGANPTISLGFLFMAASLMLIPNLQDPPIIVLAALPFGIGFGLVMPNLYSALSEVAPQSQRTGILAIGTGISSFGQFVSPVVFGPLWQATGAGVFIAAAALAITISLLSLSRRSI
jgi:MFS transporter, ACDE family, multidrug resistance protein